MDALLTDLNGDKLPELVVAHLGQPVTVWENHPVKRGTFIRSKQSLGTMDSRGLASGKLNSDLDSDLVVSRFGAQNEVYINRCHGCTRAGQSIRSTPFTPAIPTTVTTGAFTTGIATTDSITTSSPATTAAFTTGSVTTSPSTTSSPITTDASTIGITAGETAMSTTASTFATDSTSASSPITTDASTTGRSTTTAGSITGSQHWNVEIDVSTFD